MLNLTVTWQDRWQWWHKIHPSGYAKGQIAGPMHGVLEIYRHKKSGQIRVYSDQALDGEKLAVNGDKPVTLRPVGRFGKLYLGFEED